MALNNILAAPAFEVWREGQTLDIKSMLYTEDNRPRHNIFYLAHLSDTERMFFITLLLSAVESLDEDAERRHIAAAQFCTWTRFSDTCRRSAILRRSSQCSEC